MRKRERVRDTGKRKAQCSNSLSSSRLVLCSCSSRLFSLSAVILPCHVLISVVCLSAFLLVLFPCFAVPYIHAYHMYSFEALGVIEGGGLVSVWYGTGWKWKGKEIRAGQFERLCTSLALVKRSCVPSCYGFPHQRVCLLCMLLLSSYPSTVWLGGLRWIGRRRRGFPSTNLITDLNNGYHKKSREGSRLAIDFFSTGRLASRWSCPGD